MWDIETALFEGVGNYGCLQILLDLSKLITDVNRLHSIIRSPWRRVLIYKRLFMTFLSDHIIKILFVKLPHALRTFYLSVIALIVNAGVLSKIVLSELILYDISVCNYMSVRSD